MGIESSSWRHRFFADERFVLVQQIESRTIDAQIPPQFHITWIGSPRERLETAFAGLRAHSAPLVKKLWEELSSINGVRLYGPPPHVERTPTVAFTVNGIASTDVARRLSRRGLFVSHGDFYAQTVVDRLGLQPEGLVRVGCACYTSDEEIDRLIDSIKDLTP